MAPRRRSAPATTRGSILDIAERLVQRRGFNAFSYADVASELDLTTAALHYHFPGKAELGEALVDRYASRFTEALNGIGAAAAPAPQRLQAYADLYLDVLRGQRMCLCGMLAAEYDTLPAAMRRTVVQFFDDNRAWLADLLESGRAEGTVQFAGAAGDAADMIVGTLEGAMLVARTYGDSTRFEATVQRLVAEFTAGTTPARPAG